MYESYTVFIDLFILTLVPTFMMIYKNIRNVEALSFNLGLTADFLNQVLRSPILQYNVVSIPKRRGRGRRELYVANDILKGAQKIIRDDLSARVSFPDYVQGFVKRKSISTNAKFHLAKRNVLNLDIKSYFESIDSAAVINVFTSLGATGEIASFLSKLCTCNGHLIPGTVCSPVISNYVFSDCDHALNKLALDSDCSYTRYVDDITFSGDALPGMKKIDTILKSHGYERSKAKTYYQTRGNRQYVTGLTVFDHASPRIPRWRKKKLRSDIHYMRLYGVEGHLKHSGVTETPYSYIYRMDGLLSFYRSIEPWFVAKYEEDWEIIKASY